MTKEELKTMIEGLDPVIEKFIMLRDDLLKYVSKEEDLTKEEETYIMGAIMITFMELENMSK